MKLTKWEVFQDLIERYEARGIKCFPVKPDKKPFFFWKDVLSETTQERIARFKKLFNKNKSFLIAGIPGLSLAVIDIDNQQNYKNMLDGKTIPLLGSKVITPSGGFHCWFRNSNNIDYIKGDGWGELITGDGHCVLLPGGAKASYTKNGKKSKTIMSGLLKQCL